MSTTKQYGLKGVASSVQYGKNGGSFLWDGSLFKVTSDGATLSNLAGAEPTSATHLTTKNYVDSVASGLDPKESVRAATTGSNLGTYSAGQLTAMPNTLDGVTLAAGDRILVKDQTDAKQNGIYSITTLGTGADGVWDRADDHDGTPSNEVSGGNFTFVEQGTANENSGWVLQGDGNLTLDTDLIDWVQFSGAGSITAGAGLVKSGNLLSLDLFDADPNPLGSFDGGTVVGTDLLVIGDASTSDTETVTIDTILNDMDVVKGISANGMIARTSDDNYASRTITASAVADEVGLTVTNGDGVAGNPTIGLDIVGTTAASGALVGTDSFLANSAADSDNVKVSFDKMMDDLDIVHGITGNGIIARTAADTYTSRTLAVDTGDKAGLSVANGDGISGNPTYGLDINGLSDNSGDTGIDGANDFLVFYNADSTGSGGAAANQKVTIDDIAAYVNSSSNDNIISQGDSNVTVTDTGTGSITVDVDGGNVMTFTASGGTISSLAVSDLPAGRVVYTGTGGELTSEAGFEYNATTDTMTAANISGTTDVTGATVHASNLTSGRVTFAGTAGLLTDSADLTFNGTNLVVGGTAGLQVAGNSTLTGDLQVGGSSIRFTDASFADNRILFIDDGTAAGTVTTSANFTFDTATGAFVVTGSADIDNIKIDGNTMSSTDTNGDINIVPDGTGDVVIGSAGAGQILADDNQNLTVAGGESSTASAAGNLILSGGDSSAAGNGGNVTIQGGTSSTGTAGITEIKEADGDIIMQFLDSGATAVNHIDVTAAATGSNPIFEADGTDTDVGIDFKTQGDGYLVVNPADSDGSTYATLLDSGAGNELVNKKYVDDLVSANVTPGSVGSISATVDFTSATAQNIGTIPANATVLEVTFDVGTASDAATTVTMGDATNGAASYMAADENDPEIADHYHADTYVLNGGSDVTAQATVATAGTVGSGVVIIRYRNA